MSTRTPRLLVQSSPFLRQGLTIPRLMVDVIISLVPVLLLSVWYFGISALLVVSAATAGAVFTEWAFAGGGPRGHTLRDGSAALTGVILGLTLPPGFPLWMAFIGGVAGIGLGKLMWGGLGQNLFNPALVGRAFLQASFPTAITSWSAPSGWLTIRSTNLALPFMHATPDAISAATPLNVMKFEGKAPAMMDLLSGNTPGSLGETGALVIILAGIYLAARRSFDWRIPVSIVGSVALLSGVIYLVNPQQYPSPLFMLFSGGLLFGAVYMATDPVTSPLTPRGSLIFGAGIGVLVVLIRIWGGLPEGVMYAILLMNAATPLIERVTQPRVFGHARRA